MEREKFIEVLSDSYSAYYNVLPAQEGEAPLAFRADYFSRDEKYWLMKNIKVWGNETNEFAYVFSAPSYDAATIDKAVKMALDESLPRVKPHKEHQYSNVKLVFVADTVDKKIAKHVQKLSFSKSYKFSLHGYTELKAGIVDLSTRSVITNRAGHELVPYFSKLFANRD